jgi:Type III restriction enzyme, res subunit
MTPPLQHHLALNRFMHSEFGFNQFQQARELLSQQSEEYSADGHSNFYHALKGVVGLRISQVQLAEYDLRIRQYVERLRRFRRPDLFLKYYQYLAILYAEHYLSSLFEDSSRFLLSLNSFLAEENAKVEPALHFRPFCGEDLTKIAFWMATGSGKTMVMHINLWQYLEHCPKAAYPDNVLLITPNEGLSRQHREELGKSDIRVRQLDSPATDLIGNGIPVTVIEITKLTKTKKGSGLSIDVAAFGDKNLLLVDEGHRGASGELWRELRRITSERGFTFEYSATFGETVNGASSEKRANLLEEYSKAILFDYSYPHFHRDGYGKDYWITNLKDTGSTFNKWMMVGNLLSFYEQCLAFEEHREIARDHNLEKPLWVFVGHSVTGGKSREDQTSLTDVEQIISFIADFLANPSQWTNVIEAILEGQSGVNNTRNEDLFAPLFPYLRHKQKSASDVYEDIVARIFHGIVGAVLRIADLTIASGEIGIRSGPSAPYFAVVNVGDSAGLMKLLEANGIPSIKDNVSRSLFDQINESGSTINILIGSRKFVEGWDCFRVSSMGLMNLGRGEGAQIIQLFGRGVRLWGMGRSLKRSEAVTNTRPPDHIRVLETLSIFGIRADYMAKFREYMVREGISPEYREHVLPIRVREAFLGRQLLMLQPPDASFSESTGIFLSVENNIFIKLDLYTRAELVETDAMPATGVQYREFRDRAEQLRACSAVLDWDRIYLELLTFRSSRRLHNLGFDKASLRAVVEQGRYDIEAPENAFEVKSLSDVRRLEHLTIVLLRKYVLRFYERRRREWEQSRVRVVRLSNTHPNLSFRYALRIQEPYADHILEILRHGEQIYEQETKELPSLFFDRHLYQPLLLTDWRQHIEMTPVGLNEGEKVFVENLRSYYRQNKEMFHGKELFLLRNLTRGKGIGFFEALEGESFYPDFILWVLEDGIQRVAFIDPHGLCHVSSGFNDPKLELHKRIKALEKDLPTEPGLKLVLNSFILSTTRYEYARKAFRRDQPTKERFEENNVFFLEDGSECIDKVLTKLLSD